MNSGHIANISHTTFSIALPLYLFIKENHKHTCMRAMCTAHTYDLLNTIASIDQVHDSLHRSRARTQTLHRHTRTTHVHAFGRAVSESAFTLLFLIVFFFFVFFFFIFTMQNDQSTIQVVYVVHVFGSLSIAQLL